MNYLFACGGTAGHINPALAVADRLLQLDPEGKVLFVGTPDRMESELVPRAGYDFKGIEVTSFSRKMNLSGLKYNAKSLKHVLSATGKAKKIVRAFRPDIAIGTGGYVCYPVLKAAAALDVPTLVHESNAVPGLTTKMLISDVDRILVGFEASRAHYGEPRKVYVTGTPVRGEFSALTKAEAKAKLGIPVSEPLVVSVWGSLGARVMNELMAELIAALPEEEEPDLLPEDVGVAVARCDGVTETDGVTMMEGETVRVGVTPVPPSFSLFVITTSSGPWSSRLTVTSGPLVKETEYFASAFALVCEDPICSEM